MNKFRSAIHNGTAANPGTPIVAEKKSRGPGGDLALGITRDAKRTVNHRDDDRHRLAEESVTIRFKGKGHKAQLVNLSGGGAMIAAAIKPRLWDRVDLVLGEGAAIECAVRWLRGDRIGLEFAHETRIDLPPEQLDALLLEVIRRSFPEVRHGGAIAAAVETPVQAPAARASESRREHHRHPLIWNGDVLWQHETYAVRLRNVSASGVLVDCPIILPANADLMLDLGDSGQYFASVSWSRSGQAGLMFAKPFDLAALAGIRPEVAKQNWQRPTFLDLAPSESSPWAPEWGRSPLDELRANLEGFLKR